MPFVANGAMRRSGMYMFIYIASAKFFSACIFNNKDCHGYVAQAPALARVKGCALHDFDLNRTVVSRFQNESPWSGFSYCSCALQA